MKWISMTLVLLLEYAKIQQLQIQAVVSLQLSETPKQTNKNRREKTTSL